MQSTASSTTTALPGHHDFRYLLFDVERDDMLDAALRIYEPAVTRSLDRNRIRLYNLDRSARAIQIS